VERNPKYYQLRVQLFHWGTEGNNETITAPPNLSDYIGFLILTLSLCNQGSSFRVAANKFQNVPVADSYLAISGNTSGRDVNGVLITTWFAISGFGVEEDVQRSMEAGFEHHLIKPIDAQQLEALLTA
jgi:hypothetical protein